MSKFAKVVNDTVIEVFETLESRLHPALYGDYVQVADAVEVGFIKIGRKYQAPTPIAPAEPAELAPVTLISRLDFLRRFSRAERIALRSAETSDAVIADFMLMLTLAQEVHLASDDVVEGLAYLEANGLLTAGRSDAILAT